MTLNLNPPKGFRRSKNTQVMQLLECNSKEICLDDRTGECNKNGKKVVEGYSPANTLKNEWANLANSPNVPALHSVYQNSLI